MLYASAILILKFKGCDSNLKVNIFQILKVDTN